MRRQRPSSATESRPGLASHSPPLAGDTFDDAGVVVSDDTLFEETPLLKLERRLGLPQAEPLGTRRRALAVVVVGWAPIVLLAAGQDLVASNGALNALLSDVTVHARFLLAAPLLVVADLVCARQLGMIVANFVAARLVEPQQKAVFAQAVDSTRRLVRSPVASTAIIILAYVATLAASLTQRPDALASWARPSTLLPMFSPAAWCMLLVSLPLLLMLIFGWLWRIGLWARLLWRISNLDLRLIASHPDGCGGLAFLGESLRSFTIVALALSTIVAGRSAEVILAGGTLPTAQVYFNAGLLIALAALFVAPLMVFMPALARAWQRNHLRYNQLAGRIGHQFELRWLADREADRDLLRQPDFSATADLYQVVASANRARVLPMTIKDLAPLAASLLFPFVPVWLLTVPADVILAKLRALLF